MTNLHNLIEALRANDVVLLRDGGLFKPQYPDQYNWLLNESLAAVCFDMGTYENVPELKVIPELFHMPYPVTWFECALTDGLLGLLVCQVGESEYHIAAINKYRMATWVIGCVVSLFVNTDGELHCKTHAQFGSPSDEDSYNDLEYATSACHMLAQYIMAMNCANVQRQVHKAPRHINAKRIKRGRHPIFSYWTLYIPAEQQSDALHMGGTHASPRLHLRRGHIRRYAEGKYTWVNPCVVGKRELGIVAKDYALPAY